MKEPAYINDPDAIVWAASDGDFDLLVRLAEAGADVNAKSEDGRAALHMVADHSTCFAEYLLSRGADPNITDADGDTPHDYAVYHNHGDLARLLVEHGARVRAGQSAIQRHWESIQDAQEGVRSAQRLLSLIEAAKQQQDNRTA